MFPSMEQLEIDFREWKPIEGFEGMYDLRDDGLIYSYPRFKCKGGYHKGTKTNGGYRYFSLFKDRIETRDLIHRFVYRTFVGKIPKGYDVHHKNEIRDDNRVENLELLKKEEHNRKHSLERLAKAIQQYTKNGEFIAEYESAAEAERETNVCNSHITECCKGKRKSAGGFIWRYKETAA